MNQQEVKPPRWDPLEPVRRALIPFMSPSETIRVMAVFSNMPQSMGCIFSSLILVWFKKTWYVATTEQNVYFAKWGFGKIDSKSILRIPRKDVQLVGNDLIFTVPNEAKPRRLYPVVVGGDKRFKDDLLNPSSSEVKQDAPSSGNVQVDQSRNVTDEKKPAMQSANPATVSSKPRGKGGTPWLAIVGIGVGAISLLCGFGMLLLLLVGQSTTPPMYDDMQGVIIFLLCFTAPLLIIGALLLTGGLFAHRRAVKKEKQEAITPTAAPQEPTPAISLPKTSETAPPAPTVSSSPSNKQATELNKEQPKTTNQASPQKSSTIVELGKELLPEWRDAIALQQDMSRTEATIKAYLNILQKCPTALSAHDNLAGVYMRQNKNEQALAHLEKAIHPSYANAYVTLGALYYSMHSLDKAIDAFKKGGSAKSAYSNLCSAYYAQGDDAAAIQAGEKAIENDPTDPLAYGNLARAYGQIGQKDKAEALIEKASKYIDIGSIKPGISKNWFIHLVILDPETQSLIMIDPRTSDMLFIKQSITP